MELSLSTNKSNTLYSLSVDVRWQTADPGQSTAVSAAHCSHHALTSVPLPVVVAVPTSHKLMDYDVPGISVCVM